MDVQGFCEEPFVAVRDLFAQHFADGRERGAALAVFQQGKPVINLWAGTRDKAEERPWTESTLVNVFSTSKMISAICVQGAIDQGDIDVNRPVKDYWPEYAKEGKGDTTLAWMLNHRAGLPAIRETVANDALFDWEYMCQRLAAESPWWRPGEQHGYHMVTYGWLVGEVFRRAMGITLGEYLRQEIAEPFGLDMRLGLPPDASNVADLIGAAGTPQAGRIHLFNEVLTNPNGMTAKALTNPSSLMTSSNQPAWRTMELPSANVHASAMAVAQLMDLVLRGEGVITEAARERLLCEESAGYDPVLTTEARFGPGVMLQLPNHAEASFGAVNAAFGHPGSGGALAFGDPENQIGFAYVMNQMGPYVMVDPRPRGLVDTLYECLNRR
ncbi:MAG: beta-lactamase family protein [Pseudomonadales bacterium]|nr:beta-lactamase family protein [Pseudomonadales bacterium]